MFRRGVFTIVGVLLIAGPGWAASDAEKCEAAKLKEAGKYHYCRMKAESKAVKKSEAPYYDKCLSKFTEKWGKAELKAAGQCPTDGDGVDIDAEVTDQTDLLTLLISGGTLSVCGNGVVEGDEECDPPVDDACPDDCDENCTCSPQVPAIYVSISDPNTNDNPGCGRGPVWPCASVGQGLAEAVVSTRSQVRVAGGAYSESVALVEGISLLGGYNPATWGRDGSLTALFGQSPTIELPGAVNAIGLSGLAAGSVTLDGFTVIAADALLASESSYGIYLSDSDETLLLSNNIILAGRGANGADGVSGTDGPQGSAGGLGVDALDLYEAYGVDDHNCTAVNHSPGGAGGLMDCQGTATSGGDGGERRCPAFDGSQTSPPSPSESGQSGQNGGGSGGAAGRDVYHQAYSCLGFASYGALEGDFGSDGPGGVDGASGEAPAAGTGAIIGGVWAPNAGTAGGDGSHGGGGGGGGSGAGAYVHASCYSDYAYDNLGGSGGGGGSGGCGGSGGASGTSGGASFGIFVVFTAAPASVPTIVDNEIQLGIGGNGGHAGHAGNGGLGGLGGAGGAGGFPTFDPPDETYPSFPGGPGGRGGQGGHGGGGGGGAGGTAYGIFAWNSGTADLSSWSSDNTFLGGHAGVGGAGGISLANAGEDGPDGLVMPTNF